MKYPDPATSVALGCDRLVVGTGGAAMAIVTIFARRSNSHYADYIGECPRGAVADRMKRKKAERASQLKSRAIIKLSDRVAAPLGHH